jgi:hypothetical protein
MRTKAGPSTDEPDGAAAAFSVHTIAPTGVYSVDQVRTILRLKQSSLRREIREGRLRVCKRCGRYFFLGEQLLDWLRDGELKRSEHMEKSCKEAVH